MVQNIFYLITSLFAVIYCLRALLMTGFEHYRHKKTPKAGPFFKTLVVKLLTLQPLLQKKLPSKVIDHKVYERFKINMQRYYAILWVLLFIILFLGAKIYLKFF